MRPSAFAGVLGWPLERTLSPVIHNAAFRRMGLDWVYLAFPIPPERLGEAVSGLHVLGAVGANVTMPHKETVIAYLDDLSGDAREIGAVNTVQVVGDKLIGHNTDVDGFESFVTEDAGIDVAGSSCLVLGAGGAARAVVRALQRLGARELVVAARDEQRARPITELRGPLSSLAWEAAEEELQRFDVVVNATPVGTHGEPLLPGARFAPGQAVVDLIYDPPVTSFVERAKAAGAAGWGGLGMLVNQAAASLKIWSGQEPPVEAMSMAAMHAISRL